MKPPNQTCNYVKGNHEAIGKYKKEVLKNLLPLHAGQKPVLVYLPTDLQYHTHSLLNLKTQQSPFDK